VLCMRVCGVGAYVLEHVHVHVCVCAILVPDLISIPFFTTPGMHLLNLQSSSGTTLNWISDYTIVLFH